MNEATAFSNLPPDVKAYIRDLEPPNAELSKRGRYVEEQFRLAQLKLYAPSSEKRIETQINTVNARYSPKYVGLQKGVRAKTLLANNVPINAKIIGTVSTLQKEHAKGVGSIHTEMDPTPPIGSN